MVAQRIGRKSFCLSDLGDNFSFKPNEQSIIGGFQKTMRSLGQVVPSDFQIKTKPHAHIAAIDSKECLKEQKIGIEFILSSVEGQHNNRVYPEPVGGLQRKSNHRYSTLQRDESRVCRIRHSRLQQTNGSSHLSYPR